MPGVSTAEQYNRAVRRFEADDYAGAATLLAGIVEQGGVGTQLLLARAYYHSDQLPRAEETARAVLARAPSEAYAHLLLGRVLQRPNRAAEAIGSLRLAAVMDPRLAEFAVASITQRDRADRSDRRFGRRARALVGGWYCIVMRAQSRVIDSRPLSRPDDGLCGTSLDQTPRPYDR